MDKPTPSLHKPNHAAHFYLGIAIVIGLFSSGCQVVQRYGAPNATPVITTRAASTGTTTGATSSSGLSGALAGWKTSEYVRFGIILQKELGRPHRSRAQSDRSLDCSEFTRGVFEAFDGRQLPRTSAQQFEQGTPVERSRIAYGDMLFFKTNGAEISHVGIAVGFGEFIHVSEKSGVIVSSLSEPYWSQRFAGAKRLLQIAG